MLLSMVMSGGLAAMTAARFAIMVQFLAPEDYGRINIFATLVNVVPLAMGLGMSLQYQRIARSSGGEIAKSLARNAVLINAMTLLPTFVVVLVIARPISGPSGFVWPSIFALAIAASTSLTTLYSQVAVGLGYRTLGSFMMFLVNAGAVVPLFPMAISGSATVSSVLGWWALAAIMACGLARAMLPSRALTPPADLSSELSYREGLASLPSQVGPWMLLFLVRYLIGINIDETSVAEFAIAATISDMGYLVAVAALGYFANRIMVGSISVARSLLLTAPILLVVTVSGAVLVALLLPAIGKDGYVFSAETALILSVLALIRLYTTAWRTRAVGLRRLHRSAWVYVTSVACAIPLLAVWRPQTIEVYACVLVVTFGVVAIVQRISVGTTRGRHSLARSDARALKRAAGRRSF